MGNNNCLAARTRGNSNTDTIDVLVARFLEDSTAIRHLCLVPQGPLEVEPR